jgi:hypothetical protein
MLYPLHAWARADPASLSQAALVCEESYALVCEESYALVCEE